MTTLCEDCKQLCYIKAKNTQREVVEVWNIEFEVKAGGSGPVLWVHLDPECVQAYRVNWSHCEKVTIQSRT